jgi:uncharacterized protein (DUF4415 family)
MKKENKIDYSDIPETNESFWKGAQIYLPKQKKLITLRLDSDVLKWFKEEGKGYQTKINAILKFYMKTHSHHTFF